MRLSTPRMVVFATALMSLALAAGCASNKPLTYTNFGNEPKAEELKVVTAGEVIKHIDQYTGKYVRVSGEVTEVCEKKGCWLRLKDPGAKGDSPETFLVKFTCPIEGRLIPMEAVGKPVVVEGEVVVKEISEKAARHLREDAGDSPEEIARIVGPQKTMLIAAPSAKIAGL